MPEKKEGSVADRLIWKRLFAFMIDILLLNIIIATPFRSILVRLVPDGASFMEAINFIQSDEKTFFLLYSVYLMIGVLSFFYFVLLEYSIGQTVGKALMNLKVVLVHGEDTPGLGRSMVRSIYLIPLSILSLLWAIDLLYLFIFSSEGQRLTEKISRTKVIRVI